MPSGMPYEPSETTPIVTQRPLEPRFQSRMWSMAAFAADAAEDRPRIPMIVAPRLPISRMYSSRFQFRSFNSFVARSPSTVAKRVSGYIVGEWLPHTAIFSTLVTGLPVRRASLETERLWSSRIIEVKLLLGRFLAEF